MWLQGELVAHLPASRLQAPPAPSAAVSGYPWLGTFPSCCHWPSASRGGSCYHAQKTVPEGPGPPARATYCPGKSPPALSGGELSLTASQLYMWDHYLFLCPSSLLIMSFFSIHHALRYQPTTVGSWPWRPVVMEVSTAFYHSYNDLN